MLCGRNREKPEMREGRVSHGDCGRRRHGQSLPRERDGEVAALDELDAGERRCHRALALESGRNPSIFGPTPEEADLVIRMGALPDSDLIARRLTSFEIWHCASPAYLAARGTPRFAADLSAP